MYDLSVSAGGYEFSGVYGFLFLVGGVAGLIGGTEQRRSKAIGWVGLFVGILFFIVVDGFVGRGVFIYYAGIAVLVLTGVVLFPMVFRTDQQQTKT